MTEKTENIKAFHLSYPGYIERYGFMDGENKIVIKPKYENAFDFSEGRAAVCVNGKWGFIDKYDNNIVECRYDKVYSFHNGFARVGVRRHDKSEDRSYSSNPNRSVYYSWGFIDKIGKEITPIIYEELKDFSEGLAVVKHDYEKFQFIDEYGEIKFSETFSDADSFENGYAEVAKKIEINDLGRTFTTNKYGSININGDVIEPFTHEHHYRNKFRINYISPIYNPFDPICDPSEKLPSGLILLVENEKKGIINSASETVIPFMYDEIKYYEEFQLLIGIISDNFTVYTTDSKYIINGKCDNFHLKFSENIIIIGSSSILDRSFNVIVSEADEIKKDDVFYFVKKRKKWGILSHQGEIICQFIFDAIYRVNSEYIVVKQDVYMGLIDNHARVQVPITCRSITAPKIEIIKETFTFDFPSSFW